MWHCTRPLYMAIAQGHRKKPPHKATATQKAIAQGHHKGTARRRRTRVSQTRAPHKGIAQGHCTRILYKAIAQRHRIRALHKDIAQGYCIKKSHKGIAQGHHTRALNKGIIVQRLRTRVSHKGTTQKRQILYVLYLAKVAEFSPYTYCLALQRHALPKPVT